MPLQVQTPKSNQHARKQNSGREEVTHHRDHEKNEGQAGKPQVPEGAVLQLARALCCRLKCDDTAEQLGSNCSPARLQTETHLVSFGVLTGTVQA